MSNEQKWRAPVSIFEHYFSKEYSKQRAFFHEKNGFTRTNLLSLHYDQREKIRDAWNEDLSPHASKYYSLSEQSVDIFWKEDSIFYDFFSNLNTDHIVELACGHGKHVPQYIDKAKTICLVDVNKQNIDFCKKRFASSNKISYYTNNGNDFSTITSNSQTAIFSYDAMVHFELLDIANYLHEANRILVTGGKILFHHSNVDFYQELSGMQKPQWRNFMSADIFAYLAVRNGFTVLKQHIMSWGKGKNFYPNLDCLSLCQKEITL